MRNVLNIKIILFLSITFAYAQYPSGKSILEKIDQNMSSTNRIVTSKMIIHGSRNIRTIESRSWVQGTDKSFTEYLSPVREKGTKMLKLEDNLWMYSPSTDRTIQISGHMLRQSVMGSDLSYEDMLEDPKMENNYDAEVLSEETIDERSCWVLLLTAKNADVAYQTRKIWVDQERYVPLKEELFAKSGKLLKRLTLSNITEIEGRWFPFEMTFKDMLKTGEGTKFVIKEIQFDKNIPAYLFSKAALRK